LLLLLGMGILLLLLLTEELLLGLTVGIVVGFMITTSPILGDSEGCSEIGTLDGDALGSATLAVVVGAVDGVSEAVSVTSATAASDGTRDDQGDAD